MAIITVEDLFNGKGKSGDVIISETLSWDIERITKFRERKTMNIPNCHCWKKLNPSFRDNVLIYSYHRGGCAWHREWTCCPYCGTKSIPEPTVCKECGQTIKENVKEEVEIPDWVMNQILIQRTGFPALDYRKIGDILRDWVKKANLAPKRD